MSKRLSRAARSVGPLLGLLAMVGCSEQGVIHYTENPRLRAELSDDRPQLQAKVRATLVDLFGERPNRIKVPPATGVLYRDNGRELARYFVEGADFSGARKSAGRRTPGGTSEAVAGGYQLWRLHCLHCHGVQGDGNGPTADFLVPRPRDLREGKFKFVSTTTASKPTRDDLTKTLAYGLHGSSMPSFDALMTSDEMQQVIDYLIFLSVRGETEIRLIQAANSVEDTLGNGENGQPVEDVPADKTLDAIFEENGLPTALATAQEVVGAWEAALGSVNGPKSPRTPPDEASIARGRALFLNGQKLQCLGCHGPAADGNGSSHIDRQIYNDVIFRGRTFHDAVAARFEQSQITLGHAHGEQTTGTTHAHSVAQPNPSADQSAPLDLAEYLKSNLVVLKYVFNPERWTARPAPGDVEAPFALANTAEVREFQQYRAAFQADPSAAVRKLRGLAPLLATSASFQTYFANNANTLWIASHDEWGDPLRPNNLNLGVYRGGRRPLDIYYRLANGINGSKMPAHTQTLQESEIWDLVNFVLALPYRPELLEGATPAAAPAVPPTPGTPPVASNP